MKAIKVYLASAWLPASVALSALGLLLIGLAVMPRASVVAFFILMGLSLLGLMVAVILQLWKRRWVSGLVNLFLLAVLVAVIGIGFLAAAAVDSMFSEEPDNFGKGIVIPASMEVIDPVERFSEPGETPRDEFTSKLLAAFAGEPASGGRPLIPTDLTVLNEFATANRDKLIHHLAASPKWFVSEERGKRYAYRRLLVDERWENSLNGFYGSHDFRSSGGEGSRFQTRVVIGFDGPVFSFRNVTQAKLGTGEVPIAVKADGSQGMESYFSLQANRAVVEIFEQSDSGSRPATLLALEEVKRELEDGLRGKSAPIAFPDGGAPSLELAGGSQGGIYQVRAYVNPGEAGRAYLKVFEATRHLPLSAQRIKPRSLARIGWSANPQEAFRYQSEITVYEGDWGDYYPGRFELGFIPDSGAAERMLIARVFRIEGWMR